MEKRKEKMILKKKQIFYFILTILLLVIAVIFLIPWNKHEPKMTETPPEGFEETLVVAVDEDYNPYSFYDENGNPAGYDIELIYKLAGSMQKNVDIRMMKWKDACNAVSSGEADVLMGLDYNLKSLVNYELSMPLYNDPFVAFGKNKFISIDTLYDKKIATLEGGGSYAAFLTPFQLEGNTHEYPSYGEAFASVSEGNEDYAIAMYSVGRRAIASLNGTTIKAVGPTLAGNYLCIGVQKGNTALIDELNDAIILLKRSGKLDDLGIKWLGRYIEVISLRDFLEKNFNIIVSLGAFLIFVVAMFYITVSRRLARQEAMQHAMTKKVLEYQQLLTEATKGLYENIYEVDITNNCAGGESTKQYFKSLGISADSSFDDALAIIADKQVKEEFQEEYVEIFSTKHILEAYANGIDSFSYELLRTKDGQNYYWMRIVVRLFSWMEDSSVRMIIYRLNIDEEKKKEKMMEDKIRKDALTGLYNKVITEELVRDKLKEQPEKKYAFFMLDIDNFKSVNDSFGHVFGDYVICDFAKQLKKLSAAEIVGRVGGDEFAFILPLQSRERLEKRADAIVRNLKREVSAEGKTCQVTTSIGIALYPEHANDFQELYQKADEALYRTKAKGKDGYTIWNQSR